MSVAAARGSSINVDFSVHSQRALPSLGEHRAASRAAGDR
jgi:hypothetical protein